MKSNRIDGEGGHGKMLVTLQSVEVKNEWAGRVSPLLKVDINNVGV